MGICTTVRELAAAVEKSKSVVLPKHCVQIDLLRRMQQFADARDLGDWEARFQSTVGECEDQSEVGLLIWEIFEFGRFNLYGAFRPLETNHEYEILKSFLSMHGVKVDANHNNEDW